MEDLDATVKTPLLNERRDEPDIQIVKPKRKVVIEPFIIISSFFAMPSTVAYGQYVYKRVAETYSASTDISMNQNASSTCGLNKSTSAYLLQQEIQSETSYLTMEFAIVYSLTAIVSAMWLGSMSDKRGRRYPLLSTSIGGLLSDLVFAGVCLWNLDIRLFFIGQVIAGLSGGWESLLVASFAYIADTTTLKERAFRIVLLEMAFFVNASYMSIVTGYIIKYVGFFWLFLIVCAGRFLALLYVVFMIPETIIPLRRVRLCTGDHLRHSFRIFRTISTYEDRKSRLICLYAAFFFSSLVSLTSNVDTLFQMDSPLCWDSVLIGYYNCAYVAIGAIGSGIAAKILTKYLSDVVIAIIATLTEMVKYFYRAFCVSTVMMFIATVFPVLGMLLTPMLRSLVSKTVDVNEQGAALSFLAILQLLCNCFGNLLFHTIYSETLFFMNGFVYIASGCTLIFTLIFLWKLLK